MKLSGKYFGGMLEPFAKFLMSSEIVSYLPGTQFVCPREFKAYEGGIKGKIAGVTYMAGYKYELTDNTYTGGGAHLESNVINAGAEYTLWDKINISAGFKDIFYKGTEFPYAMGYTAGYSYDAGLISYGAGIDYEIIKQAKASISFTNTIFTDNLNDAGNFGAQEVDARVVLKF
jgi:hypothetical protein